MWFRCKNRTMRYNEHKIPIGLEGPRPFLWKHRAPLQSPLYCLKQSQRSSGAIQVTLHRHHNTHSPGGWITGGERFFERRVIPVNVVKEANLVFLVHCRRAVYDQNRNARDKIHLKVVLISPHGGFHALQIPPRIVSKNPRDKIGGLVHANAPVTEIANILRKQLRRVRAMEIDIVLARVPRFLDNLCCWTSLVSRSRNIKLLLVLLNNDELEKPTIYSVL